MNNDMTPTREQLIEMAKEAGFDTHQYLRNLTRYVVDSDGIDITEKLECFAKAVLQSQGSGGVADGHVLVTVSGAVGIGKSAIAGEIEILCKALGLEVDWTNGQQEKNLTHSDWTTALELYKPKVIINESLAASPPPPAEAQGSDVSDAARYRWLVNPKQLSRVVVVDGAEVWAASVLSEAIDSAIASESKHD